MAGVNKKKMDFKLEKIPFIICACFVLFNFCEWYNVCNNKERVKTQLELLRTSELNSKI